MMQLQSDILLCAPSKPSSRCKNCKRMSQPGAHLNSKITYTSGPKDPACIQIPVSFMRGSR